MTPALAALATPDPRGLGGLVAIAEGRERPLPLREVRVRARVVGDCCRTEVEQRYANPYDAALEAVHIFPLPPDGAVVEMELRAGDTVVRADCRERQEAEATFAEARAAGHRAALLTAERADVHTLRVTNLPPRTEVVVRIALVERVEATDGRYRWRFPTTVAPRYMPGTATGHAGPGVVPDTDRVPDASRISPPVLLGGGAKLDLEIDVRGAVRSVESSLHVAQVMLDGDGVRVAPKGGATVDRDFVVVWTTAAADTTEVRAFTDGSHTLVVVEPPGATLPPPLPRDAVFVIDISGSMQGTKMDAAKRALVGALHGLLPGDRFRLIAFDTRLEHFRAGFTPYDDRTLAAADAWIERLYARGGTDMLPAIRAALEDETPAGRVRTVLFVTDGQAGNDAELVAAVANRRGAARFFTLGVDTAVNEALLSRLARVGGGSCELCTPSADIEAVVNRIEARFGMPLADDVRVEGGEVAGAAGRALFSGRPVTVLLRGAPGEVRVTGRTAAGTFARTATPARIDVPLGALWARERVAELEDRLALRPFEEEALRGEILRVALAHGVASRFTAFVAVETSTRVDGARVEVVQPAVLPYGWEDGADRDYAASYAAGGAPMELARMVDAASFAASPPIPPPPRASRARGSAPTDRPKALARPRGLAKLAESVSELFSGALRVPEEHASAEPRDWEASAHAYAPPRPPASSAPTADLGAALARTQSADGSYGGDVGRTAAALVTLLLLGSTRHAGPRKRTVIKAAAWLAVHAADPRAALALAALAHAEHGRDPSGEAGLAGLGAGTPEGALLGTVLAARGSSP